MVNISGQTLPAIWVNGKEINLMESEFTNGKMAENTWEIGGKI